MNTLTPHMTIEYSYARMGWLCWLGLYDKGDGKRLSLRDDRLEDTPADQAIDPLPIDEDGVQSLMDSLWRAGVRPNERLVDEHVVKAQQQHIDDLRGSHNALVALALRDTPPADAEKAGEQ